MKAKFVNEAIKHLQPRSEEELSKLPPEPVFTQLCVWPGTTLSPSTPKDLEDFFKDEMGTRIKYAEEVTTLPGDGGEGGRTDQFFFVHNDDVGKFAIPRLKMGIRWWEDVLDNMKGRDQIYPKEILEKYPYTW